MDQEFKKNNFDLLRLIAATQVVLSHSIAHLGIARPWWWGVVTAFPGVPVFFAISGFLISAAYERSSNLRRYFENRVLRIYPGLWCCLLVTVLVTVLFGYRAAIGQGFLWMTAQAVGLIYTPAFLASFGFGSYNGSLWTIPIELQFYALLPLLYFASRKLKNPTGGFLSACVVFLFVAYAATRLFEPLAEIDREPIAQKLLRYSFIPHFYLFLFGVIMQRCGIYRRPWVGGRGVYWITAYLMFYAFVPIEPATHVIASILLSVAVVSCAFSAPNLSDWLLRSNDISYGVYIYHGLLLNVLVEIGIRGRLAVLPLILGITYGVAYLSWILVERPCLRRKRASIHALPNSRMSTYTN